MQCPKCNSEMKAKKFQDIQIDKCTSCEGLWFDIAEINDLLKSKGSEKIDVEKVNKETGKIVDINCPKCDVKMLQLSVVDKPHIKYEQCHSCHGTFFDAGEYRDYKINNFLDFFIKTTNKE